MTITRQQRRAINRKAAAEWVRSRAKEHTRSERKQFARQLAGRLNSELPRSAYEPQSERSRIIAPDEKPLVVPVGFGGILVNG